MKKQTDFSLFWLTVIIALLVVVNYHVLSIQCDCGCPDLKPNEICGYTCSCLAPILMLVFDAIIIISFIFACTEVTEDE